MIVTRTVAELSPVDRLAGEVVALVRGESADHSQIRTIDEKPRACQFLPNGARADVGDQRQLGEAAKAMASRTAPTIAVIQGSFRVRGPQCGGLTPDAQQDTRGCRCVNGPSSFGHP